jgi:hypothetical protein
MGSQDGANYGKSGKYRYSRSISVLCLTPAATAPVPGTTQNSYSCTSPHPPTIRAGPAANLFILFISFMH